MFACENLVWISDVDDDPLYEKVPPLSIEEFRLYGVEGHFHPSADDQYGQVDRYCQREVIGVVFCGRGKSRRVLRRQ